MQEKTYEMTFRSLILSDDDKLVIQTYDNATLCGYASRSKLVARAVSEYDPNYSQELLMLEYSKNLCSYFMHYFNITYKDDIYYVFRHPEAFQGLKVDGYVDDYYESNRKTVRYNISSDNPEYKKACKLLDDLKPRERAMIVPNILRQFFIRTNNEFFFYLSAAKAYANLQDNFYDTEGNVSSLAEGFIEIIWSLGH